MCICIWQSDNQLAIFCKSHPWFVKLQNVFVHIHVYAYISYIYKHKTNDLTPAVHACAYNGKLNDRIKGIVLHTEHLNGAYYLAVTAAQSDGGGPGVVQLPEDQVRVRHQ